MGLLKISDIALLFEFTPPLFSMSLIDFITALCVASSAFNNVFFKFSATAGGICDLCNKLLIVCIICIELNPIFESATCLIFVVEPPIILFLAFTLFTENLAISSNSL